MTRNRNIQDSPSPPTPTQMTGTQVAFRVGSEFFSGILVGLIFGYGIDHFFSTKPWGMVVMILLGFAAGMRNIIKLFSLGQTNGNSIELTQGNPPKNPSEHELAPKPPSAAKHKEETHG